MALAPHLSLSRNWILVLLLISALLFIMAMSARNNMAGSDPRGALLTAQQLLHEKTVDLSDVYGSTIDRMNVGHHLIHRNDGLFYSYPLGSSYVSIPFVLLANKFGLDMRDAVHDKILQRILAGIMVALAFLGFVWIFSFYFSMKQAVLFGVLFTLGTTVSSTMSVALWNLNFTTLTHMAVLILLLRREHGYRDLWFAPMLGFLLALAFIFRPTSAVVIIGVFLYLLFRNRKDLPMVAVVSLLILTVQMVHSVSIFQLILPPNYFQSVGEFRWSSLLGILFSPSRGLFIYSSFLLLVFIYIAARPRLILGNGGVVLVSLISVIFTVWMISKWAMWWGGHSFGYRLLTDMIPFMSLLSAVAICDFQSWKLKERFIGKVFVSLFAVLSVASVWIHTIQGLYNKNTNDWHLNPNPDFDRSVLFDWRYPQFLASEARNVEMAQFYASQMRSLHQFEVVRSMAVNSPELGFIEGWGSLEYHEDQAFAWSIADRAEFEINPMITAGEDLYVGLRMASYASQKAEVWFNDAHVGSIDSVYHLMVQYYIFKVPYSGVSNGANDGLNVRIHIPNARSPYEVEFRWDHRRLGFSLSEVLLLRPR